MQLVSDNTTHIADIGFETYKAGYSGAETPTIYGRTGQEAAQSVLARCLSQLSPEPSDTPLICIEDTFAPGENRRELLSGLVEACLCSGVLFINSAVADCFSHGKSTGLMVRLTGGSTQVVPVIDGYSLSGSLRRELGGLALTQHTLDMLRSKSSELGVDLLVPGRLIKGKKRVCLEVKPEFTLKKLTLAPEELEREQLEIARSFKEAVSFVGNCQPKYYEFPTGFATRVYSERNRIPELYFSSAGGRAVSRLDPFKQMSGPVPEMGLIDMVKAVVGCVDSDYTDALLGNVFVTGGGALIPGITERIQSELAREYPGARIKVSNDRREFSTFFGGSILGSLGATSSLMITKGDFDECGVSILERKSCEWVK